MKNGKWVPWRVCAGVLGVLAIAWLWTTKDVAAVYRALPAEAAVPVIMTNVLVTALKMGLVAAAAWAVKKAAWRIGQRKSQGE